MRGLESEAGHLIRVFLLRYDSLVRPKIPLPRIHAFEFHEQPWLPETLRRALTEWLRALWEYSRAETVIAPLLHSAIVSSGATRIVDLCSGRSGPIIRVQAELARSGIPIPVVLTDKFPDREAWAALTAASGGSVTASIESVDATAVPETLIGLRTLFNSFHHFRPHEALRILAEAYRDRQPVGVFEITARTLPRLALCFPASFLSCFLLIWRMRPRRASWWILTWCVPLIPFIVGWDAFVSHLRSYRDTELQELTRDLTDPSWCWQQGSVAAPHGGVKISFLIGTPVVPRGPHSR